MHIEFADGDPNSDVYGSAPEGGVVFTPAGRLMAIVTSSGRLPPQTGDDRVKSFRFVAAYTGQACLEEEGRSVTDVDASWDSAWAGTQERFFSISGDILTVRTAKQSHPSFPGRDLWMVGIAERDGV